MPVTVSHVVFDCENPGAQAAFWSAVLDRSVDEGGNDFFATIGRKAAGVAFLFIKVPEPRNGKNRLHVDLSAADREAEVDRVIGLGAKRVGDFDEYGARWTTLSDPEGNLFDIGAELS